MNIDFDYDLSIDQWEALRALRNPVSRDRHVKGYVVQDLVGLGLVAISDGMPIMTATGRKVLVRGSCRLLDLAS